MNEKPIFKLDKVKVWFPIKKGFLKKTIGYVKSVDGVSLNIYKGETIGVVGESGCGKTTLGKALMLLEAYTDGSVLYQFNGQYKELKTFDKKERLAFCKQVQMVFQDPYSAFNPMKTILQALEEPLIVHGIKHREDRLNVIKEMMDLINVPLDNLFKYPHELSGGQRQRLCLARALEINPQVIVCDEVVSALDVSVQAQVLNLMKDIQKKLNLSYIFIAHDLSVVQYMSDRIAVMYLGEIVEMANSEDIYKNSLHPYTLSLLSAIPTPTIGKKKQRIVLQGDVPSPINKPKGCPFSNRCNRCMEICKNEKPRLISVDGSEHIVSCHLYKE